MKNFIRKHSNLFYFALTFGWTWILVFVLILSGGVEDISKPTPAFVLIGLLCGISPSLSAILIARISGGKAGLKALIDRFGQKNSRSLLVLALLIVPAVAAVTIFISHHLIRTYEAMLTIPVIFIGLIWPLFSSFGEEFGWRGFILPQLLKKFSPLKASVVLGLIWAVWHIPMDYIAYKDYGIYLIPAYLVTNFINLTVHALIMTYLYRRSGGNLKLMVLYHYTITAAAILPGAFFKFTSLPQYTVWEGVVSVSLLLVLAIVFTVKDALRQGQEKKVGLEH